MIWPPGKIRASCSARVLERTNRMGSRPSRSAAAGDVERCALARKPLAGCQSDPGTPACHECDFSGVFSRVDVAIFLRAHGSSEAVPIINCSLLSSFKTINSCTWNLYPCIWII
jgi:hypothetical protein